MDLSNFSNTEAGRIISMILILLISVLLGWMVKEGILYVFKKSRAKRKIDPGKYVLSIFIIRLAILVLGVSYAISLEPHVKSMTTSLLAGAGVATAIVGFASKDVLSNLMSGAMIIIFRPFTISHWIKVGNVTEGSVEEIKMLYTVIKDRTNRRLIIPNSKIVSSDVINSSYREEDVIELVDFEISYESNISKAKEIIREVAEASPLCMDKRSIAQKQNNDPIVEVRLHNLGNYSISLQALVWVDNPRDARKVSWALNEEVRERFNKAGVEIPYPNLVVRSEPGLKEHDIK
ncbi:MAG: mechanosensitive ion channel family protein [Bacteroidales bacterium]|nr:mechanosensitive ion channel family protein [Bacteroidales bacterium]